MELDSLTKEHKILVAMRQTLSGIIRDTTPKPGMIHVLSEPTVEDIKACLGLIAAREREIRQEEGIEQSFRPRFVDEPSEKQQADAQVIKFKPKPNS